MSSPMTLSVVVVWRDVAEDIAASLATLLYQVIAVGGEVLVVTALPQPSDVEVLGSPPGLRWVGVEAPLTEPRAWAAGFAAARGMTVAFAQARCRYGSGWAEAVVRARIGSHQVVTGPVLPSPTMRGASLASYLCDYGSFANPAQPEPGRASSNNLAIRREALADHGDLQELDKSALLASGRFRVIWSPEMVATVHTMRSFGSELVARFRRGRHYGTIRAGPWPRVCRLVAGLGCFALPLVLFFRLLGNEYLRRRHATTLTFGLPWIALSLGMWSLGEMSGYWSVGCDRASRGRTRK